MTERDAATIHKIREFQDHTRECAVQMMMNAIFIQQELPNVRMSDELRQRTEKLCSILIGTKHDLVTEIFELDEALETGAGNVEVLRRINRMVQWAGEDVLKMHEIVTALAAEGQKDVMNGGAYLLVSESAVNILTPRTRMRQLAAQLGEALS
jgi:predicted DNA-binding protein